MVRQWRSKQAYESPACRCRRWCRPGHFGPKTVLVTTDVDFVPGLSGRNIDDVVDDIERGLKDANDDIQIVYVEVEEDGDSSAPSVGGESDRQ